MRLRYYFIINLILLCLLWLPVPSWGLSLSLDEAVSRTLAASDDLKKSEANIQKMNAVLKEAEASRWLNLEGSATYMNNINVERPGRTQTIPGFGIGIPNNFGILGVNLTQPLYTFGRIENAVNSAKNALQMSKHERDLSGREMRFVAIQIYYTARLTDELVKIAENSLYNALESERLISNSNAQRTHRADLIKVTADIAARRPMLEQARIQQEQAYRMLRVMADLEDNTPVTLTTNFPQTFGKFDVDELQDKMDQYPEFLLLNSKIQFHEDMAQARQAGNYPQIGLSAGYNYIAAHTSPNLPGNGHRMQSANIGLGLTVPLFDGGTASAQATQERMEASKTRQDLNLSQKMRRRDLSDAVSRHERMIGILKSQREARDLAGKAYAMSLDRFEAGQTSAVELNDVEQALTQTGAGIVNTLYELAITDALIRKLTGN